MRSVAAFSSFWVGEEPRVLPRREANRENYMTHNGAASFFIRGCAYVVAQRRLVTRARRGKRKREYQRSEGEGRWGRIRVLDTPRDAYEIFMDTLVPWSFTPFVRAESKVLLLLLLPSPLSPLSAHGRGVLFPRARVMQIGERRTSMRRVASRSKSNFQINFLGKRKKTGASPWILREISRESTAAWK